MTKVNIEKGFDFVKTYRDYGFDTDVIDEVFKRHFYGLTEITYLHNCVVIKTVNIGADVEDLERIRKELGAMELHIGMFSPYVDNSENGFVYNIFFMPNCCSVKYPI